MRFFLDLAYHCEVTAADGSEWQILAGKTAEDNDRLSLKEIQCLLTSSSQLPSPRCQECSALLVPGPKEGRSDELLPCK